MIKNHGFIKDEIVEGDHYVFGGYGSLQAAPIRPDRDWRPFLPSKLEIQNLNNIEPQACTNFGTDLATRILLKTQYQLDTDYSQRFFAKASGTNPARGGNSPHVVAEYLRNNGLNIESDWPFDAFVDTVEKFYATPPSHLYTKQKKFVTEYKFGHDWILPPTADKLWDALQYSPVGFSVRAWTKDSNGMYFKPQGSSDNHWCLVVYAEFGKYWLVVDSYMDEGVLFKKVRWDALPEQAKRYTLQKKTAEEMKEDVEELTGIAKLWQQILDLFRKQKVVDPKVEAPAIPIPLPSDILDRFCQAIQKYEDYVYPGAKYRDGRVAPSGSLSYRLNNPGNIRCSAGNEANWNYLATGQSNNFCKFPSYEVGYTALKNQVRSVATGKSATYNGKAKELYKLANGSQLTLIQYFSIYAPTSDNNNPQKYAEFVAKECGISAKTQIGDLLK